VVVEPGWKAELTSSGHLVLKRVVRAERSFAVGTEADPVALEVFNNLFMAIAEQVSGTPHTHTGLEAGVALTHSQL
jgi:5-oxoprolinase (ATP-hydrolysing)